MEYRKSFDSIVLKKIALTDPDESLQKIMAELAENLLNINNQYCQKKYPKISDVFMAFPASNDHTLSPDIVSFGNMIITQVCGVDSTSDEIKREILDIFLKERKELKNLMADL